MKTNHKKIMVPLSFLLSALLFVPSFGQVRAISFTPLSGQMGLGATGSDVTNLQTFLASNSYIYPEGIVSGYYGRLTQKAVAQLQLNYGLPTVGRVGPMTLTKINSLIASGYGLDISGPTISNVTVIKTNTIAGINWSTNEIAKGKVYYSALPMNVNEATENFAEPVIVGGASSVQGPNAQSSQSISIPNLQPNTVYYYMIVATDLSGNVSVTVPSSFTTNP